MVGKLTKCPNGHFYDGDKFASCPHCESSNVVMDKTMKLSVSDSSMAETEKIEDVTGDSKTMPQSSLSDAIEKAKQNAEKAMVNESDDAQKTISFFSMQSGGVEPTVGVLLCVEGPSFGNTYLLKTGKNFVGRSAAMDIVIADDNGVSRDKHAIVLYEPKSKLFIAQPGESRELFYVNDQVVLAAQELKAYDEIALGNTKLVFIPICGERFSWEQYTKV